MASGGFAKLPVIISVALGLGFGASMFLNIYQNQQASQDKKLLQGTITDLRYQVNQDKLASASPSVSPLATPESSPSPSPAASPSASPTSSPVLGASTTNTATVTTAGKFHVAPSAGSGFHSMLPVGTVVTRGSDLSNGYQQITFNGTTGYFLAAWLK